MSGQTPEEIHDQGGTVPRYEPADSFTIPRFSDVRTFMRLPNVRETDLGGGPTSPAH